MDGEVPYQRHGLSNQRNRNALQFGQVPRTPPSEQLGLTPQQAAVVQLLQAVNAVQAANLLPAQVNPAAPSANPTRFRGSGIVTALRNGAGYVNKEIYFQASSVIGRMPEVGENVMIVCEFDKNRHQYIASMVKVMPLPMSSGSLEPGRCETGSIRIVSDSPNGEILTVTGGGGTPAFSPLSHQQNNNSTCVESWKTENQGARRLEIRNMDIHGEINPLKRKSQTLPSNLDMVPTHSGRSSPKRAMPQGYQNSFEVVGSCSQERTLVAEMSQAVGENSVARSDIERQRLIQMKDKKEYEEHQRREELAKERVIREIALERERKRKEEEEIVLAEQLRREKVERLEKLRAEKLKLERNLRLERERLEQEEREMKIMAAIESKRKERELELWEQREMDRLQKEEAKRRQEKEEYDRKKLKEREELERNNIGFERMERKRRELERMAREINNDDSAERESVDFEGKRREENFELKVKSHLECRREVEMELEQYRKERKLKEEAEREALRIIDEEIARKRREREILEEIAKKRKERESAERRQKEKETEEKGQNGPLFELNGQANPGVEECVAPIATLSEQILKQQAQAFRLLQEVEKERKEKEELERRLREMEEKTLSKKEERTNKEDAEIDVLGVSLEGIVQNNSGDQRNERDKSEQREIEKREQLARNKAELKRSEEKEHHNETDTGRRGRREEENYKNQLQKKKEEWKRRDAKVNVLSKEKEENKRKERKSEEKDRRQGKRGYRSNKEEYLLEEKRSKEKDHEKQLHKRKDEWKQKETKVGGQSSENGERRKRSSEKDHQREKGEYGAEPVKDKYPMKGLSREEEIAEEAELDVLRGIEEEIELTRREESLLESREMQLREYEERMSGRVNNIPASRTPKRQRIRARNKLPRSVSRRESLSDRDHSASNSHSSPSVVNEKRSRKHRTAVEVSELQPEFVSWCRRVRERKEEAIRGRCDISGFEGGPNDIKLLANHFKETEDNVNVAIQSIFRITGRHLRDEVNILRKRLGLDKDSWSWICKSCGHNNRQRFFDCKHCGTRKVISMPQ